MTETSVFFPPVDVGRRGSETYFHFSGIGVSDYTNAFWKIYCYTIIQRKEKINEME